MLTHIDGIVVFDEQGQLALVGGTGEGIDPTPSDPPPDKK